MKRDTPFAARIAFRLPQSLYDQLERWADEEDRPLANLVYTLVRQAVTERERASERVQVQQEIKS
jgi:hypothetical protein